MVSGQKEQLMIYCLAVFKSRTHTVGFAKFMRAHGVDCSVVPTPTDARLGCGVSAKFPYAQLSFARQVVSALGFSSFSGIYSVKKDGLKQYITLL